MCFTQILREIALFSGKIYTGATNFTRPPVMTVATNINSDQDLGHLGVPQGHRGRVDGNHDADVVQAGDHRDGALPLLLRHQPAPLPNPALWLCKT